MAGINKKLRGDEVSEVMGIGEDRLSVHHCKEVALTQNYTESIGEFEQRTYNALVTF